MEIANTLPCFRPLAASSLREQERELAQQVEDLRVHEQALDAQTGQHLGQMQALRASGRTLQKGKNHALPFAIGSFAVMVTGLVGGAATNQPWLMGLGVAGLLGTMVSAAFVETSQDRIDEMGQSFEQHQQQTRALGAAKDQVERQRQSLEGDLQAHRQVAALADPAASAAVHERPDSVTVAGVVLRKTRHSSDQKLQVNNSQ